MDDHCCGAGGSVVALETPTRNRYFYGKLLDAFHFELEQHYFNHKRWLVNQLAIGRGVLCGLRVVPSADGKQVCIGPGAAIDGWGREIIVPATFAIDPRQPLDECGEKDGDRLTGAGTVTVWLCYHECPAEPEPVLVGDCGAERRCAPGAVRERYHARVTVGGAPALVGLDDVLCRDLFAAPPDGAPEQPVPPTVVDDPAVTGIRVVVRDATTGQPIAGAVVRIGAQAAQTDTNGTASFPNPPANAEINVGAVGYRSGRGGGALVSGRVFTFSLPRATPGSPSQDVRAMRREMLCDALADCAEPPEDACVPLALVTLGAGDAIAGIEECAHRPRVYSNATLLELILCLARRVDECCGKTPTTPTPTPTPVKALEYIAGDNQSAVRGEPVPQPLIVRVTEDGTARGGEPVTFAIDSNDGRIGATAGGAGETTNPVVITSDSQGRATLPHWRLGLGTSEDRVSATIAQGSPKKVTFRANALTIEQKPPKILAIWPPNGDLIDLAQADNSPRGLLIRRFRETAFLEITFDHEMDPTALKVDQLPPDRDWIRVLVVVKGVTPGSPPVYGFRHLKGISHFGRVGAPPQDAGFIERFLLGTSGGALDNQVIAVFVRPDAGNIASIGQSVLLDAEFDGFADFVGQNAIPGLPWTAATFDDVWNMQSGPHPLAEALFRAAHAPLQPPQTPYIQIPAAGTGDGQPGGRFLSWFRLGKTG